MKLYGTLLSPFVVRALLVVRAKGQEIEPIHPPGDGEERAAYLKINPSGKMPFLDDDGFYLSESAVIADYFDAVLPGPKLWPADPRERARHAMLTRFVDTWISPGCVEVSHAVRDGRDQRTIDEARAKFLDGLRNLEHFRNAGDEWLAGDAFGHADAAIIPLLYPIERFNMQTGLNDLLAEHHPNIVAYWNRVKASPIGRRIVDDMTARADLLFGAGSQTVGNTRLSPKEVAEMTAAARAAPR